MSPSSTSSVHGGRRRILRALVAAVALVGATLLPVPAAQASYGTSLYDHQGNYAGRYGWESVRNDVYLVNSAGGVPQIRLYAYLKVDGTYYEYKDVFVPDGYSARYRLYPAYEPTTVKVVACYYSATGAYLGRCSQFFTRS